MKERLHPIYKFMIVFPISLVGIFFIISITFNKFITSFIIGMIISILYLKDSK